MESDLTNIEGANQNLLQGLELLQTSCMKCRNKPDYLGAIPYFKKAADIYHGCGKFDEEVSTREKLVRCFKNTKSYWEEGREHEKNFKVQLNQLKNPVDAYNSSINSFHAYAMNKNYDNAIKSLSKASDEFLEHNDVEKAEDILKQAFEGIDKYYHILTFSNEDNHNYIYECIDKYIDVLFSQEKYEDSINISKKTVEMIQKEKADETKKICRYYCFEAIALLLLKNESEYNKVIDLGVQSEGSGNLCQKLDRLVNVVKQNDKENKNIIKSVYTDIAMETPNNVSKMLMNRYVKEATSEAENNATTISEEDMK